MLAAMAMLAAACGGPGDGSASATTGPTPDTGAPTSPPPGATTTGPDADRICSAEDLPPTPAAQTGLPEAVEAVRTEIVDAATRCDYEALAQLALAGELGFTFTFGTGTDPAAFWQDQERGGEPVLATLVELLDRPYATTSAPGGEAHFAWPSAFGYETWTQVPKADREALRPLYGDDDFAAFAEFGGYIGYRVGITSEGDWIFFVAGD